MLARELAWAMRPHCRRAFGTVATAPVGRHSHSLRGAEFEVQAVRTLARSHFRLTRTGGANDGGVDFEGYWHLDLQQQEEEAGGSETPSDGNGSASGAFAHIPVVGQCKNTAGPVGVEVVREFDGAMAAFRAATRSLSSVGDGASTPAHSDEDEDGDAVVLGVLVASGSFTKNARRHSSLVSHPQLLVTLGEVLTGDRGRAAGDKRGGSSSGASGRKPGDGDGEGVPPEDAGASRRVVSVLPNRAFLRVFPRIGFTVVDATPAGAVGGGGGDSGGGQQQPHPAFWYGDGHLVLM